MSHCQISAWALTDPTSDALAQQASALWALTSSPDGFNGTTLTAAAGHCVTLSRCVGPGDVASARALLSSIGTMTLRALELGVVTGTRADLNAAQWLVNQTHTVIASIGRGLLTDAVPGQAPVSLQVRVGVCVPPCGVWVVTDCEDVHGLCCCVCCRVSW